MQTEFTRKPLVTLKTLVKRVPILGPFAYRLRNRFSAASFRSGDYWERRYQTGGNSGAGSYGDLAEFKAEVLNEFVKRNAIQTVIEFGCGDGNQLRYMQYPNYTGIDVSPSALEHCRTRHGHDDTKRFVLARPGTDYGRFDLAISLDVLYHLIEDRVFEAYMSDLCRSATRFVIIYASNGDPLNSRFAWPPHVRHRRFTDWMQAHQPAWQLIDRVPNRYPYRREGDVEYGSFADFYVYACTS
jgi:SAM-dependent methyltransferase